MWYPHPVNPTTSIDFKSLYTRFDTSISHFDCGKKCAPHNEYGIPFCCDTRHAIPTAYGSEWSYLEANTDLWHLWVGDDQAETNQLRSETPVNQVLIECLGHEKCQRNYRSITCRAFPFFPYISKGGDFLGLSYYWQYEDRCWVISNLDQVRDSFRSAMIETYEQLFRHFPDEFENFRYQSIIMRRVFGRRKRAIPLLHRNGYACKVGPKNEPIRRVDPTVFTKHSVYEIAALMPFPDEI